MQYNIFKMSTIKTILDTDIETFEGAEHAAVIEAIQKAARVFTSNLSVEKNSFPLRPSSALKSKRELYYGLVNHYAPGTIPTNDIEGRACMLLELGHAIEKHLVDNIKRVYKIPFTGQKITYGQVRRKSGEVIELGGELDFVIELPGGERIICDSKSSGDYAFKLGLPKEEHVAQINLYLHSEWARSQNVNRAWVFYYNKNTSDLRLTEFYYDALLAKRTLERFQDVMDCYEAGTIPPREYVLSVDWQASYSAYRTYEWSPFKQPLSERPKIVLKDSDLPQGDKKALLRKVAKYGPCVITTPTRQIYAIANEDCSKLMLRDEGADGFSV